MLGPLKTGSRQSQRSFGRQMETRLRRYGQQGYLEAVVLCAKANNCHFGLCVHLKGR